MKKRFNTDLLGWMVAAIFAGTLASSGFQGNPPSFAVCDIQAVIKKSDLYKVKEDEFKGQFKRRQDLLAFINDNRVMTAEEFNKLRDLSLKPNPTQTDTSDLETLKTAITANTKKMADIQAKTSKTADDVSVLEDYQNRVQKVGRLATELQDGFGRELPQLQDAAAKAVEDQARQAAQAIGKEQGYTIVFDMLAAPYGEHDITDATLARMNKK